MVHARLHVRNLNSFPFAYTLQHDLRQFPHLLASHPLLKSTCCVRNEPIEIDICPPGVHIKIQSVESRRVPTHNGYTLAVVINAQSWIRWCLGNVDRPGGKFDASPKVIFYFGASFSCMDPDVIRCLEVTSLGNIHPLYHAFPVRFPGVGPCRGFGGLHVDVEICFSYTRLKLHDKSRRLLRNVSLIIFPRGTCLCWVEAIFLLASVL
mmetsp:Transcript_30083/g.56221  ORF Transcript_30083/g.56221 Transcript_30083/m.56221 type:complete len:208 (+) Transcript_30083:608-1231(+)